MTGRLHPAVWALVLALGCGGEGEAPAVPADGSEPTSEESAAAEPEPIDESREEATVEPLARKNVEVYFPSADADGLVSEFREIFDTATPGDRAKQIVADLISGPTSPQALRAVPSSLRLRQAYVVEGGTIYLDFTADLREGLGGGSTAELLTVYSIVDSVVLNVPELKRAAILIDGRPVETLNGHVDLRRPLPPDTGLIRGSITVRVDPLDALPVTVAGAGP